MKKINFLLMVFFLVCSLDAQESPLKSKIPSGFTKKSKIVQSEQNKPKNDQAPASVPVKCGMSCKKKGAQNSTIYLIEEGVEDLEFFTEFNDDGEIDLSPEKTNEISPPAKNEEIDFTKNLFNQKVEQVIEKAPVVKDEAPKEPEPVNHLSKFPQQREYYNTPSYCPSVPDYHYNYGSSYGSGESVFDLSTPEKLDLYNEDPLHYTNSQFEDNNDEILIHYPVQQYREYDAESFQYSGQHYPEYDEEAYFQYSDQYYEEPSRSFQYSNQQYRAQDVETYAPYSGQYDEEDSTGYFQYTNQHQAHDEEAYFQQSDQHDVEDHAASFQYSNPQYAVTSALSASLTGASLTFTDRTNIFFNDTNESVGTAITCVPPTTDIILNQKGYYFVMFDTTSATGASITEPSIQFFLNGVAIGIEKTMTLVGQPLMLQSLVQVTSVPSVLNVRVTNNALSINEGNAAQITVIQLPTP